jgi:hypothetical protein
MSKLFGRKKKKVTWEPGQYYSHQGESETKYNLKAWKKYGEKKTKGSFGEDDRIVEGTLKRTKTPNIYKFRQKGKLKSYKITDTHFDVTKNK